MDLICPFEVLFGREPNLPIDTIIRRESLQQPLTITHHHAQMIKERAITTNTAIRQARRERFDRNRRTMLGKKRLEFDVGDKVYLSFPKGRFRPLGGVTKFSKRNDGPYTVLERRCEGLVYKIQNDVSGVISNVSMTRLIRARRRHIRAT